MYSGCVQLKLTTSWEHININLANATRALFGTKYAETVKIKVTAKIFGGQQRCSMFTLTHCTLAFSPQIHANCRIRSVYFADRFYTYRNLPNDYKVVENITSLAITPVMPEKPAEQHRPKKQRPGFQSVLNSVKKDPLRRWRKAVSVHKDINCLKSASLVVMQHCPLVPSSLLSVILWLWSIYHKTLTFLKSLKIRLFTDYRKCNQGHICVLTGWQWTCRMC